MEWREILELIITFTTGGGFAMLGMWGFNRRQKRGEIEKLEIDVRKLQEGELRDRTVQLVTDLSEANNTIKRISRELQLIIAREAEKDITIAKLTADNKRMSDRLNERACKRYCTCIAFEADREYNGASF